MKKIIAVIVAVLALSALTVTAFASGSPEPAEEAVAAPEAEEAVIAAALTEEQALAAALKDAGLKEAAVTVSKNKLSEKETEDGETVAVYTVKFSTETTEFKYILDANTGAILYKSMEFQSPDVVFKSRDRNGSDGEKSEASGEMRGEAKDETEADAATGASTRGSGRRSSTSEPDAEAALTDTTAA